MNNVVTTLGFDTTASKRAWNTGAAKLLQELMDKKLFHHARRDYVYGLTVKAVPHKICD